MGSTPLNAFETLGVEPKFSCDLGAVEHAALIKLASHHPDLGSDDASEAEAHAASINEARDILLDHERRANHLLEVLGGPTSEQDKTLPEGFLQRMMMQRMEIDQAIADGGESTRATLLADTHSQRDAIVEQVRSLFEGPIENAAHRAAIRVVLNEWRYIERLIEQLCAPGSVTRGVRDSGAL